jgi:hypothetical protein
MPSVMGPSREKRRDVEIAWALGVALQAAPSFYLSKPIGATVETKNLGNLLGK